MVHVCSKLIISVHCHINHLLVLKGTCRPCLNVELKVSGAAAGAISVWLGEVEHKQPMWSAVRAEMADLKQN